MNDRTKLFVKQQKSSWRSRVVINQHASYIRFNPKLYLMHYTNNSVQPESQDTSVFTHVKYKTSSNQQKELQTFWDGWGGSAATSKSPSVSLRLVCTCNSGISTCSPQSFSPPWQSAWDNPEQKTRDSVTGNLCCENTSLRNQPRCFQWLSSIQLGPMIWRSVF